MKGSYNKNYKTLLRKIKDLNLNKWKDISRSWIRRHNIVKMSILPQMVYTAIPVKIQQPFLQKWRAILKVIGNCKKL